MSDYDFGEKKPDGTEKHNHEALDGKGFVSDSSCEEEYERHESHAYDRDDGSSDYSRTEKDDERFSSGTSGGTFYRRYPGGSYNRGSESGSYSRNGSASGSGSSPDAMVSPNKTDGLGIASMVCGITSLLFCCLPLMGLIVAIVGLVLGIVSQKRKPNGFAIAGIITSAFGIAFGIILTIGLISGFIEGRNDIFPPYSSDPEDSSFDPNNVAKAIITRLFRG